MADSLIDRVMEIERRAEELVQRARAQVKELEEDTTRQLTELRVRYQAELDRQREQLQARSQERLRQVLAEEDQRFSQLRERITKEAEPQVESAGRLVVERFFGVEPDRAAAGGGEDGHGH